MPINNLPNKLCIRQSPKFLDNDRFSKSSTGMHGICYEILESKTKILQGFISINNTKSECFYLDEPYFCYEVKGIPNEDEF